MSTSITAGATRVVQFDKAAGEFVPSDPTSGEPTFTIRSLSYWQWQEVQDLQQDGKSTPASIKRALELGLVGADAGPPDEFLANPKAPLVIPLYNAVFRDTWGN